MSHYKHNSNKAGNFLGGAILGGLIGAALGVLFAPQSGEKTRAQIKKTSEKAYKDTKHKALKLKHEQIDPQVNALKGQVQSKWSEVEGEVKKKVGQVEKEIKKRS